MLFFDASCHYMPLITVAGGAHTGAEAFRARDSAHAALLPHIITAIPIIASIFTVKAFFAY